MRDAWALLTSPRTTIALLALLALFTIPGGLIPQSEVSGSTVSPEQAAWLAHLHSRAPSLAAAVASAGLLGLFSTPAFRLLLALAAGSAVVQGAAMLDARASRAPKHAAEWMGTFRGEETEAWQSLKAALVLNDLQRPRPSRVGPVMVAGVRRRGFARCLPVLCYAAVLALILAAAVAARWGWQSPTTTLLLGEERQLDDSRDIAVQLDEVRLIPEREASELRVESVVSLRTARADAESVTLGAGRSARHGGLTFYQVDDGPSILLRAIHAQGDQLDISNMVASEMTGRALRLAFEGRQQEYQLLIREAGVVLQLVHYAEQGEPGHALQVRASRWADGSVLAERVLDADGELLVADLPGVGTVRVLVSFERYITVRAESEPEVPLAAAGALLGLLGLTGALLWPPRSAWITLREEAGVCRCRIDVAAADGPCEWRARLMSALEREGWRTDGAE
ncbi:MAG: hypothetical protein GX557_03595 [Chloroflexi bacterium]|nr:hypothetical protein [Chloroflexota bacterium]